MKRYELVKRMNGHGEHDTASVLAAYDWLAALDRKVTQEDMDAAEGSGGSGTNALVNLSLTFLQKYVDDTDPENRRRPNFAYLDQMSELGLHSYKSSRYTRNCAKGVLNCLRADLVRLAEREAQKKDEPKVDVPAGRYCLDLDGRTVFVKVDRPTEGRWAGYTFVRPQRSDFFGDRFDRQTQAKVLATIAQDVTAHLIRYGVELGECGNCGRTLTDETSRAVGVGPDCRKRLGITVGQEVLASA
jgi:hypothetical protein